MKPGDLVMLKNRTRYTGVDVAEDKHFNVKENSIGVFVELSKHYNTPVVHILTGGRIVACAPGVWSLIDETR